MINSDRIFGLVVVLGALAFFAGALQIQISFLSDPLGPRVFPILIAGAALLCGVVMLLKPDAEPEWPGLRNWIGMGVALVVLIAYAYALAPLGFVLPTAIAATALSYQISPRLWASVITGISLAVGLYLVFKYGLGLGLVALPKALFG
ncbi:MAG: tripartite tricarboxylate transporter TctB family protein [Pseudorhodobacter sp.]|nr:tripartite tricarboxylate transporter TctB family protein [Pseudorhodobacter sp.]